MRFKTAYAQYSEGDGAENALRAVREIRKSFQGFSASLIIFFAATDYDDTTLAREMADAFPGVKTIGCTTAGEACDDKPLNASVVAMGFADDVFEFCETAVVLKNAKATAGRKDAFDNAADAMTWLGRKLDVPLLDLDYHKYVGFMLGDLISSFTEGVIEKVGEMTDVIFVGGIAGDDYHFNGTNAVFYDGRVYRDGAAILALWRPRRGFSLLKTQAVELTDKSYIITRADEANRIIYEFDGRPAAQVYADAIGMPADEMGVLDFDEHPLAMVADGEPYLRALVSIVDGDGLFMFARVREGTQQTVTNTGDVLSTTKEDLERALKELGEPVGAVLHINCARRLTALRNKEQVQGFTDLFHGFPSIAFSSYGEIYVGIVAITSTMILFK